MKLSQFNVVHEHNGSLLIMNARTGGILSLNPEYAQKFKRIQEGDVRDADDLVAELIRGGILVNEERDELGGDQVAKSRRALCEYCSVPYHCANDGLQLLLSLLL